MNETKQPIQSHANTVNRTVFWGTIVMNAIILLVYGYFSIFLIQQAKTTVIYSMLAVFLFSFVSAVISGALTLRGRQELGIKLTLYTLFLIGLTIVSGFQGRAVTASFSILTISMIAILRLLPSRLRRQYFVITAVVMLAMWAIEWSNPPWRVAVEAARVGPVAVVVFSLIFGWMIFTQSRRFLSSSISTSLRVQITVWTGAIAILLSVVIFTYSVMTSRRAAVDSAQSEALAISETQAGEVKGQIDSALDAARTMAYSLGSVKDPENPIALSRDQANGILRKVEEENPNFLGTWTLWEPNAFDGLDAQYANTPLHDQTGRFIPYWVRTSPETIEGVAIIDYETPGIGDFYLIPRATRRETIISPYFYPINGVDVLMTTVAVPVVENNQFYGVAGVDLPIGFVQGIVDRINLYNGKAAAALFTDTGSLVAVRNQPELTLQPATSLYEDFEQIQPRIAAGETFVSLSPDGQYLRVFAPVEIGESGSRWSFSLIIPFSEITAPSTASAVREAAISLGLIALSLLALWFFTGQLVRPILDLITVAHAVSAGNLNVTANTESLNEIGILARTFNAMTSQLRETLTTLENRVTERTQSLELAAEVGHSVSRVSALDVLLKDAAEIIRSRFDLYYVQVYLADANQTSLLLLSGTGKVGEELLGRGHRLPLNTGSINGRAATEKKSVVIPDTTTSTTFRPNLLLPNTRSEMAVPLLVGDNVVGVLDLQSEKVNALGPEILPAFEALAGQLAIAIQNASLLAETEQARAAVEAQAQRLMRANWVDYLDAIHKPEKTGFVFEQNKISTMTEDETIKDDALVAPISVTGQTLGNIVVEMSGQSHGPRTAELVNTIALQVAQHIESLRLLESTERYRAEAEEATRRLTRTGWNTYMENADESLSYFYDLKEVHPHNGTGQDESALSVPLKVHNEILGKLAIQGLDVHDNESVELANAVAERLSAHIESLRLHGQTESALAQSEKLFEASRRLTQALGLQELMAATVTSLNILEVNRALLTTFDYDEKGDIKQLNVIANWWNGTGHEITPIGTRYSLDVIRLMPMFISPVPIFFSDTLDDERVDATTMQLVQRLNLRAVAVLPLHLGARQIGALILEAEAPHNFTQDEIRLFSALAPQIATITENQRQFERAQKQAEREAMLNVINQKIQGATSVEAVLQIAARELGHALGAPMTIAQLSVKDKSS